MFGRIKNTDTKALIWLRCVLIFMLFVSAFRITFAQQDTVSFAPVLTAEEYIELVKRFHPVAKQADILVEKAKADLVTSRAGFDPTVTFSNDSKKFDGINYYNYQNIEMKIPTWYGVEVRAGLEDIAGDRVTSESTLGETSYLGVSVPLLRNLLMDKRRAALLQAKLFRQQSEAERQQVINDLLYEALVAYRDWASSYEVYAVIREAVNTNLDRFRFVRLSYIQGDKPAVDTVEALTQLQQFQNAEAEASMRFQNATLELANYLWTEQEIPYLLPSGTVPDSSWLMRNLLLTPLPESEVLLNDVRSFHPILRAYNFKLSGLDVERRFKFQGLLPTLNLKANLLRKGYEFWEGIGGNMLENNYAFGIQVGIPLRLSEGRGEYRKARLKIEETRYDLDLKRLSIENKVRAYLNELSILKEQIRIGEAAYQNYLTLLRAEENKFRIGESSLFLLNSRENKVLESRQKLIELKAKFYKAEAGLQRAAGRPAL